MDSDRFFSDEEFLAILQMKSDALSATGQAPVTRDWVDCLIFETRAFMDLGESLTVKRLALWTIKALTLMEMKYKDQG